MKGRITEYDLLQSTNERVDDDGTQLRGSEQTCSSQNLLNFDNRCGVNTHVNVIFRLGEITFKEYNSNVHVNKHDIRIVGDSRTGPLTRECK